MVWNLVLCVLTASREIMESEPPRLTKCLEFLFISKSMGVVNFRLPFTMLKYPYFCCELLNMFLQLNILKPEVFLSDRLLFSVVQFVSRCCRTSQRTSVYSLKYLNDKTSRKT